MATKANPGKGLSPRRRGNPGPWGAEYQMTTVYPRAGGGTTQDLKFLDHDVGLSPRRRGNLGIGPPPLPRRGSIPAQAGEPYSDRRGGCGGWVYPRAGGETSNMAITAASPKGLSPRRRGNRREAQADVRRGGSIPAQAGEPSGETSGSGQLTTGVYPRAGGGTGLGRGRLRRPPGLSPRRRGNRVQDRRRDRRNGSIPAQAGEPGARVGWMLKSRVYPRAGGGTPNYLQSISRNLGLSPRRRGNHISAFEPAQTPGSIPAQAGEPLSGSLLSIQIMVYPRAGGGTGLVLGDAPALQGLSPRRRGNRP